MIQKAHSQQSVACWRVSKAWVSQSIHVYSWPFDLATEEHQDCCSEPSMIVTKLGPFECWENSWSVSWGYYVLPLLVYSKDKVISPCILSFPPSKFSSCILYTQSIPRFVKGVTMRVEGTSPQFCIVLCTLLELQFKFLVRGRGCTCQLMGSAHLGRVVKKVYYLFLSCLPFLLQTSPAGGENLGVILSLQETRNFSVCLVALHLLMNTWECLSPFSLRNVVLSYTIPGRSLWKALVVIPLCLSP